MYAIHTTYVNAKGNSKLDKVDAKSLFFTAEELIKYLLYKYNSLEISSLYTRVSINKYISFYISMNNLYKELVQLQINFREINEYVTFIYLDKLDYYVLHKMYPPFIKQEIREIFTPDRFDDTLIPRIKKINFYLPPNFGRTLIGTWFCKKCNSEWMPKTLEKLYEVGNVKYENNIIYCPNTCGTELEYDEAE